MELENIIVIVIIILVMALIYRDTYKNSEHMTDPSGTRIQKNDAEKIAAKVAKDKAIQVQQKNAIAGNNEKTLNRIQPTAKPAGQKKLY